jgi:hypothetical protein
VYLCSRFRKSVSLRHGVRQELVKRQERIFLDFFCKKVCDKKKSSIFAPSNFWFLTAARLRIGNEGKEKDVL